MERKGLRLFDEALKFFSRHISSLAEKLDRQQVSEFVTHLHRIDQEGGYTYVYGAGRSRLVGEAFATRLSNLEYNVFIIGEPTTPAIRRGDAVILVSGSGETRDTVHAAQRAKERGAEIFAITSKPHSHLAKYCDHLIKVPGRTRTDPRDYTADQIAGRYAPLAPMGTLFEISAYVVLDSIVPELARLKGFDETKMRKRHFDY
jgi:3-hexulose-6-phosphate synthase/6-phospho-3-hexuloisomerase